MALGENIVTNRIQAIQMITREPSVPRNSCASEGYASLCRSSIKCLLKKPELSLLITVNVCYCFEVCYCFKLVQINFLNMDMVKAKNDFNNESQK